MTTPQCSNCAHAKVKEQPTILICSENCTHHMITDACMFGKKDKYGFEPKSIISANPVVEELLRRKAKAMDRYISYRDLGLERNIQKGRILAFAEAISIVTSGVKQDDKEV